MLITQQGCHFKDDASGLMPKKNKISDIPLADRPREKIKEKSFGIIQILREINKYLFLIWLQFG